MDPTATIRRHIAGLFAVGLILMLGGCSTPYLRGTEALRENRLDAAIVHLQQAVRENPRDAQAHTELGVAYYQKGAYAEARDSLMLATAFDARSLRPHLYLALASIRLGDDHRAIEALREVAQLARQPWVRAPVEQALAVIRDERPSPKMRTFLALSLEQLGSAETEVRRLRQELSAREAELTRRRELWLGPFFIIRGR